MNASAVALMNSAKRLTVTARSVGGSFTVTTADATAAAGTEGFSFIVVDSQ
jgi:hypothetical protein